VKCIGKGVQSGDGAGGSLAKTLKIIVEKHPDGYIAYPVGVKGVVVGEGDTYEEALADVRSAIRFHVESFGDSVLEMEPPLLEAFVTETNVDV
jgi:predicted RNase H-like HicB family nuclease